MQGQHLTEFNTHFHEKFQQTRPDGISSICQAASTAEALSASLRAASSRPGDGEPGAGARAMQVDVASLSGQEGGGRAREVQRSTRSRAVSQAGRAARKTSLIAFNGWREVLRVSVCLGAWPGTILVQSS